MDLVLQHIPHIIPAVVGLLFLVRFGIYARRLPPNDLTDAELAEWNRKHGRKTPSAEPHDVQFAGAVSTSDQGALDVRSPAGAGNQRHN
jgi:hypothetical protein